MRSTAARRNAPPRPLTLERLEAREVPAGFAPTAAEQVFLERLNDARADPAAYGRSINLDLSGVAPSPALAFHEDLIEAARLHSQDMNARRFFQHTNPDGANPGARLTQAGFAWTGYGESIAGGTAYPDPADALRGLIIDQGVPNLGHRKHLLAMEEVFKSQTQVGVGVVQRGSGPLVNYYTIDSAASRDARPFLTGVVYKDANRNGRYDAGEGLGGVGVSAGPAGSTTTWDTGGYRLPLNPGTYAVAFSGGALAAPVTRAATVGPANARLNVLEGAPGDPPPARDDGSIGKLYRTLLGREPGAAELQAWLTVQQVSGLPAVVTGIARSTEALTRTVGGWYRTYLGRAPSGGEEQGWVGALRQGLTEEQILAGITGSDEYAARAHRLGPSPDADVNLVQALFQQFLRRAATEAELAGFKGLLPAVGRAGAAQIVLFSLESRTTLIRSYYTELLGRPQEPSAAELNAWVYSGLDLGRIRLGFIASAEFLNKN